MDSKGAIYPFVGGGPGQGLVWLLCRSLYGLWAFYMRLDSALKSKGYCQVAEMWILQQEIVLLVHVDIYAAFGNLRRGIHFEAIWCNWRMNLGPELFSYPGPPFCLERGF